MPNIDSSITINSFASIPNGTHWQANFVCKGCSKLLKVSGTTEMSWAFCTQRVQNPASANSVFTFHDAQNHFWFDLSKARVSKAEWNQLVSSLGGPALSMEEVAPAAPAGPVRRDPQSPNPVPDSPFVQTSVVQLPPTSRIASSSTNTQAPGIKTLPPATTLIPDSPITRTQQQQPTVPTQPVSRPTPQPNPQPNRPTNPGRPVPGPAPGRGKGKGKGNGKGKGWGKGKGKGWGNKGKGGRGRGKGGKRGGRG
jgi:hypothetical protein